MNSRVIDSPSCNAAPPQVADPSGGRDGERAEGERKGDRTKRKRRKKQQWKWKEKERQSWMTYSSSNSA